MRRSAIFTLALILLVSSSVQMVSGAPPIQRVAAPLLPGSGTTGWDVQSMGLAPPVRDLDKPLADIDEALLNALAVDGTANFFVKMAVEADLSAAYDIEDWNARGEYVWNTLNEVARTTQAPVIEYAQKHGLDYHSMLTTNSVFIRGGNLRAVQGLATLPGVAYLRLEQILQIPDPFIGDGSIYNLGDTEGSTPEATTAWGITDTKADQVWALGVRGSGIKVANIDTGVQWDHPALVDQFACPGDPTAPRCWRDPSNICGAGGACDNNGHGTHTMGTMVAEDNPALTYIAGMAPGATWIACKGCESSSCSDYALNTCADWVLAPGGSSANRPHVVNNSWGGSGGDTWYQAKVNAWQAAGIFPAFSAGNSGSSCRTLGSPGDYQQSFGTAAHDRNRTIASFSSRGPSTFGHTPYTKPNISAPGVSVCSTVPTNGWSCSYSGTSMASPHTAGAVALVWSACPSYVGQMDATFELLQNNADASPAGSCGAPLDGEGNYTYGYGYLDALAAVQQCSGAPTTKMFVQFIYLAPIQPQPSLDLVLGLVRILDENNTPVEGATVDVEWTLPMGYAYPMSKSTNAAGLAVPLMVNRWPSTYELCVTGVTKGGFVYDPSMNYETCDTITP